ncbi:MAG: hypothetical protein PHP05_06210, partial [Sideroxydans sp.]|nr:hypothetical protein [Sideroxydans sp.]
MHIPPHVRREAQGSNPVQEAAQDKNPHRRECCQHLTEKGMHMIYRDPYTPHTGSSLHVYPSDTKHTLSRSCRVRSLLAFLLTCLLPFSANAFQAMDIESKKESSMLFAPYESNSFMFKRTDGDAPSSEINISVRYFFKDP